MDLKARSCQWHFDLPAARKTPLSSDAKQQKHQKQTISSMVVCRHQASKRIKCFDCMPKALVDIPDQDALCELFHQIAAKLSTSHERSTADKRSVALAYSDRAFRYGEIQFWAFASILSRAIPDHANCGMFYDLGSGSGKAVLAAALLFPFEGVTGIELLPSLHESAVKSAQELTARCPPTDISARTSPLVTFQCADIFTADWSDGDIVFVASTAFDESMMEQLSQQATRLKPGSRVITLSLPLPAVHGSSEQPHYQLLWSEPYRFSWGNATVYLHQKL